MSNKHDKSIDYTDSLMPGDDEQIELEPQRRWHREKYVPIAAARLTELVLQSESVTTSQRESLQQVCQLLDDALHAEYHQRQIDVKSSYAPFDPDSDQSLVVPLNEADREGAAREVVAQIVEMLERANYERRTIGDIQEAMDSASAWGVNLHVDFDVFELLEVFSRGDVMSRRTLPQKSFLHTPQEVEVAIYQRLVVIFRLHPEKVDDPNCNTSAVHVKMFKNVPKDDLEMLLPGVKVRMSLTDQGKIWLPAVSGIGLVLWKVFEGAVVVVFVGVHGILAFLMLLSGMVGYGLKSFYGYLNTRTKYQLNLTRNLYYQNLGNNGSVLLRTLDEAEEQDYREMLLAYFTLWQQADSVGWTTEQLDAAVEDQLEKWLDMSIDFEVDDALNKLLDWGLAETVPNDRYRAVSLHEAQLRLKVRLTEKYQIAVTRKTSAMASDETLDLPSQETEACLRPWQKFLGSYDANNKKAA